MDLFAQTTGGQAGTPSMLTTLIPFVLIFAIFYLIIILPARKKQKKHQSLVDSLKGGERILTIGGIYGTVSRVFPNKLQIEIDKNTKIFVAKTAISTVIQSEEEDVPAS